MCPLPRCLLCECAADPDRSHAPPAGTPTSPYTVDQLQWRQFITHFTWLDIARGGTYLHPDAIRPRTLEDSLVDDFFRVLCGSEIPQSSWALATRRSYQAWVTSFCNFCAARRICPLPIDPDHFLRWLELLVTKLAGRTVTVAISAIVAWCALNNLPHPIEANPVLRRAWKGLVRTRSVRVTPQKLPLTELLVLAIFQDFWRHHSLLPGEDFVLLRSVALFLTGFESGPRVREATMWTVCDHWPQPDGSQVLRFLDTKNNYDQNYLNSVASLAPAEYTLDIFPAASSFLLRVYLPVLRSLGVHRHPHCIATPDSMAPCRVCPRLFPTLSRGHTPTRPATGTMTAQHVSDMLRFWLLRLGVKQPDRWSGISMRSGTASLAALMKVDPEIVRWHCRWSRGVPGVYTVKPHHARLAVSQAVGRSYVLAGTAAARRPDSDFDDECHICKDGGDDLLMCDAIMCRRVAHPACVALTRIPTGIWFCNVCATPPVSHTYVHRQSKR